MDIKRVKSYGRPAFLVEGAAIVFDADEATSLDATGIRQFRCPLTASIGEPTLQAVPPLPRSEGWGMLDKFPWE